FLSRTEAVTTPAPAFRQSRLGDRSGRTGSFNAFHRDITPTSIRLTTRCGMIAIMRSFLSGTVAFTTAPLAIRHTGKDDHPGARRRNAFHRLAAPTPRSHIGDTMVQCSGKERKDRKTDHDRKTDLSFCFHRE